MMDRALCIEPSFARAGQAQHVMAPPQRIDPHHLEASMLAKLVELTTVQTTSSHRHPHPDTILYCPVANIVMLQSRRAPHCAISAHSQACSFAAASQDSAVQSAFILHFAQSLDTIKQSNQCMHREAMTVEVRLPCLMQSPASPHPGQSKMQASACRCPVSNWST